MLSHPHILAIFLGNKRSWFDICDSWISIGVVCFKILCFWTSEFGRVFLKSPVSFTSALCFSSSFYWNMASLDCSYRASRSRRNTDMGRRKRIGAFPPTFTFAASARYCHLYFINTVDALLTVCLTWQKTKKKPKQTTEIFDDNFQWRFSENCAQDYGDRRGQRWMNNHLRILKIWSALTGLQWRIIQQGVLSQSETETVLNKPNG